MLRVVAGLRFLKVQLFLVLCISLFLYACGSEEAGTLSSQSASSITKLSGPDSDPANSHIPDILFPSATPEEFSVSGGISISRRTIGVFFKDSATVAAVNSLIASIGATIIGGEPLIKMVLLSIPDSPDLSSMVSVLEQLNQSPEVAVAAPNVEGVSRILPPYHSDQAANGWEWDTNIPPMGSNYGLELIRMPQAWNLNTYAARHGAPADVGIIDLGFDAAHPDLKTRLQAPTGTRINDHGTHVAGIMASTWNNQWGVEGVTSHNPTIFARTAAGASYDMSMHFQDIQTLYRDILWPNPSVVAVNESIGLPCYTNTLFPWHSGGCSDMPSIFPQYDQINPPNPLTYAQLMDLLGDVSEVAAFNFSLTTRSNFLIPAAVGYDATPWAVRVQDDSPMSNAAVRYPEGHYIAVEAIDRNNAYDPSKMMFNLGGTVSAPGYDIRSAEIADGNDIRHYDQNADFLDDGLLNHSAGISADDGDPDYAVMSGTSMSTPHVTGLIAYLWHLDSTLKVSDVRKLITDPAYTVPTKNGTKPRIDAFSAAMGIDVVQGNKKLQKALVNVDDGTKDGNQRTIRGDDGKSVGDFIAVPTGDNLRGDERGDEQIISMADFRAFRDAMTQVLVDEGLLTADVSLDGSPTHFKKDLNFDGCVSQKIPNPSQSIANPFHPPGTVPIPLPPAGCANAPGENVFPRYDFNGDGKVDELARVGGTSGFPSFKGNDWTDLDVLKDVWPLDSNLNEGYDTDRLLNMLPLRGLFDLSGSGDIEFRTNLPLGGANPIDTIEITIEGLLKNGSPMARILNADTKELIWTVPRAIGDITVKAVGVKGDTKTDLCFNRSMPISKLLHGQDTVVTISECTTEFYVAISGTVYSGTFGDLDRIDQNSGTLFGQTSAVMSMGVSSQSTCPASSSAMMQGVGSMGSVSMTATAQAAVARAEDPMCTIGLINGGGETRGDSRGQFTWGDTITILDTSGTLPSGTPVDLQISAVLSGEPVVSPVCDPTDPCYPYTLYYPSAGMWAQIGVYQVAPTVTPFDGLGVCKFKGGGTFYCTGENIMVRTISTSVGAKIRIEGNINFSAWACAAGWDCAFAWNADWTSASASASASGFDLKFYIAPLTPNISYTSASGQTYFSQ